MEQMVNDIKYAIQTALQAGEDRLKVQLKVKEIADGLNNPEIFLHVKPPVAPEPPPVNPPVEAAITSIEPPQAMVDTPLFLTITGTGFTATSVVSFDGDPVPTTFVSETELNATVEAADNDVVDTFEVTVDGSAPVMFEVIDGTQRAA